MAISVMDGHTFVSADDVEVDDNTLGGIIRRYIGGKGDMSAGPKAFLDQVVEGLEVESHFHPVDQYQILFGAPGSYYQRSPVPKVLVHYTDAYSVYGPFGSNQEGRLEFLTLRAMPSALRGSMPQYRDQLLYRGRRHHLVDVEVLMIDDGPESGSSTVEVIVPVESDGLAGYLVRIGPHTQFTPPTGELRTGRYTVVLEGDITVDGRVYGPRSIGWSSGESEQIAFGTGSDGAALLLLHMPYPNTPSVRLAAS